MSPMWRKEAVPENDNAVGVPENPHLEIHSFILTQVAFESSNDFTYDLPHDELCLSLLPPLTPSHPLSHHQSSICISLDCLILLLVTKHLDVLFHTFSSCPSSDIHFKETSRTAVSFNEWLTCCIAFEESSKKYTFCCTFSASTPL